MVIGDKKIEIIEGDSYKREITVEGVDSSLIEGIYFSCEVLKICRKLSFEEGVYILSFTPEETEKMGKFQGNYDLTVKFIGNIINTIQYRSPFIILPKNNKVMCYGQD